jgi:hypothetical protein
LFVFKIIAGGLPFFQVANLCPAHVKLGDIRSCFVLEFHHDGFGRRQVFAFAASNNGKQDGKKAILKVFH